MLAAALIGSALVGLLPAVLSPSGAWVACAAALTALAAVLLRRAWRGAALGAAQGGRTDAESTDGELAWDRRDWDLRWQRGLFYLGTLTVTESTFRPAFGLTLSELFFVVAFAGCVFAILRGHRVARVPALIVVGATLFALGGAISSLSAHSPEASGAEVLHALYVMVVWAWTAAMVLRSRTQILFALSLWGVSAAANGLAAIAQVLGIDSLAGGLEGTRTTGFTEHPNDLGGVAAVALVPALLLASRPNPGGLAVTRVLRWTIVGLIAVGLILSASVASMLAALVGLVVWLSSSAVRAPSRVALVLALAAPLMVVAVIGGRITSPSERLQQVTTDSATQGVSGSGEERIAILEAAWPVIRQDPLVGTGLDDQGKAITIFTNGQTRPYQIHGAPVAAWYEAGILGLVGIVIVFWAYARTGWLALRSSAGGDDLLIGWALLAAWVAFVVYALTVPFLFQQFGWFSGVVLVAWGLRREAVARVAEPVAIPGRAGAAPFPTPLPR
ncbi:MAG TPA: O-antigen ligase family protein [Solirubrobacterales bacterium]